MMTKPSRRVSRTAILLVAGLALGLISVPANAACTGTWNVVSTPNQGEAGGTSTTS